MSLPVRSKYLSFRWLGPDLTLSPANAAWLSNVLKVIGYTTPAASGLNNQSAYQGTFNGQTSGGTLQKLVQNKDYQLVSGKYDGWELPTAVQVADLPAPAALPRFVLTGKPIKLVFDGNSIPFGLAGDLVGYIVAGYQALAQANGVTVAITFVNLAISGQTEQQMVDSYSDVQAAYDPACDCILISLERYNQIRGFSSTVTAQQALTVFKQYDAKVRQTGFLGHVAYNTPPDAIFGTYIASLSSDNDPGTSQYRTRPDFPDVAEALATALDAYAATVTHLIIADIWHATEYDAADPSKTREGVHPQGPGIPEVGQPAVDCLGTACFGAELPAPRTASTKPFYANHWPNGGVPSTVINVTGSNFDTTTSVTLNGVGVPIQFQDYSRLRFAIPSGATTGNLVISNALGTATSTRAITVAAVGTQPTISSFSPSTAPSGGTITVNGTQFTGLSGVTVNGKAATYTLVSATQLKFIIPLEATTGTFTVTTGNGSATSASVLTISNNYLPSFAALPNLAKNNGKILYQSGGLINTDGGDSFFDNAIAVFGGSFAAKSSGTVVSRRIRAYSNGDGILFVSKNANLETFATGEISFYCSSERLLYKLPNMQQFAYADNTPLNDLEYFGLDWVYDATSDTTTYYLVRGMDESSLARVFTVPVTFTDQLYVKPTIFGTGRIEFPQTKGYTN